MLPYEIFQTVFKKWMRVCGSPIGHYVIEEHFTMTIHTIITVIGIYLFNIFSLYTMFTYDTETALKAFSVFGLGIQGWVKSTYILHNRKKVAALVKQLESIYIANQNSTKAHKRTMETYSTYVYRITQMFFLLYFLCMTVFDLAPLLIYLLFDVVEPVISIYVPFVDPTEKTGYIITTGSHLYFIFIATIGFVLFDSLLANFILHVLVYSGLIEDDLNELNEMISDGEQNELLLRIRFRNILLMHKEMRMYVDSISDIFFHIVFGQILAASSMTAMIIFVLFTMTWYPGYFLLLSVFYQTTIFCALGTVVEIANDRVYKALRLSNLYFLPIEGRKDFIVFILSAQRAKGLTIGGLTPLNMDSWVTIMKKIYTFTMMLYNFVA